MCFRLHLGGAGHVPRRLNCAITFSSCPDADSSVTFLGNRMHKVGADQLGTRIRFLCTAHSTAIPTVTMHHQKWAYCPGGFIAAQKGHFWTAIEPTNVREVTSTQIALVRQKGEPRLGWLRRL